ncbi:hypothetical protein [Sphingomonas bacterium]|uniref:hypothetical protein n=1 Tax=Sphingomonas bacterium TaxID=1895847 RepID=UPI001575A5BF|nr:hypothetical protein [Sphingomonas bacterium]
MTANPLHIAAQGGWSWTTVGVGLLNLLVGGALVAWIKQRPKMRELEQNAEGKLRDDLMERVRKLEADATAQAALREAERARHEAEMKIMRHRVNNSDQCLDALLLLLKTAPEKVNQAVQHIEEMRTRQRGEIAAEKGAQAGAQVAVTAVLPLITPA